MIQCNPNWGPKVLPTIILIYLIPTIWIHRFYIRDYMYSTPIHNSYTHLKYFIYKVLETYFQGPILNLEVKTLHIMPCSCNLYRTQTREHISVFYVHFSNQMTSIIPCFSEEIQNVHPCFINYEFHLALFAIGTCLTYEPRLSSLPCLQFQVKENTKHG